jgi:hypothetical protein
MYVPFEFVNLKIVSAMGPRRRCLVAIFGPSSFFSATIDVRLNLRDGTVVVPFCRARTKFLGIRDAARIVRVGRRAGSEQLGQAMLNMAG